MSNIDTSVYPAAFDTEKFFLPASNNIKTTLATFVAPNQNAVINVNSTAGFPDEGVISIDKEVIYYRSKTASSFRNITRGYDGTIAFQHATGADVELRWVAAHHNRLKNALKTIQRTLGINPQGGYPDLAARLSAYFNSANKRVSQVFLKNDRVTKTETGYAQSGRNARMFVCPERFVKVAKFGPSIFIDGITQIYNDTATLVDNLAVSVVDCNDGSGKGIITCSTGSFVADGVSIGDIVVVKGTPTNNDAYIVDTVLSNTQIKVSEVIFGVDQLVGAVGSISIIDVSDVNFPVKDAFCIATGFSSTDEADAVIFINPPKPIQQVRFDYDIKNAGAVVSYSDPIAVLADYQAPMHTGTVPSNGSDVFPLDIGRSRALVFNINLTGSLSNNVKIEIFGKSDLTERQYIADFIDLTMGPYQDIGVWHYSNKDATTNLYVKITDLSGNAFNYTLTLEVEALGTNV